MCRIAQYVLLALAIPSMAAYLLLPHSNWRIPSNIEVVHFLWLACLLMAGYIYAVLYNLLGFGAPRYIRNGIPLVGQVLHVSKEVPDGGIDEQYAYVAMVIFRDPETNETKLARFPSDSFGGTFKDHYETSLAPGQYVTLVYLPDNFYKSVRVYGFLNLNPERQFVRKTADSPEFFITAIFGPAVAVLIFGWMIYESWGDQTGPTLATPLTRPVLIAEAAGIVAAVLLSLYLHLRWHQANRRRALDRAFAQALGKTVEHDEPLYSRLMKYLGILVTGFLLPYIGMGLVNEGFDKEPATPRAVVLLDWPDTTARDEGRPQGKKKITFQLEGKTDKHRMTLTGERLEEIGYETNRATALVKPGFVGWPWVEAMVPEGGANEEGQAPVADE